MEPLTGLALALFLAMVSEVGVEAILGVPFQKIGSLKPYSWSLYYVSLVAGFLLSYLSQTNIFLGWSEIPVGVGIVLTGVLVGGGSTLLHRLFPNSLGDKNA